MTVGAITAQLRLDMTNFREGLVRANSLLEQYSGAATKASAILAGFGAAVAGGLGMAAKVAAEFEAEMRNVNSILHETEPALAALSASVQALAGKVGQAPATLARGLYDIASSGFSGAEGLKVLEASAVAATAGITDTATASRAITAVLNAYGMSADEAGRVSDVLFKTVERGVITFGELASQIGDVISTAAQAKVPIEEVGAAIATMTRAGVQPAEAVTSLNQLLLSFISPGEQAAATANRLGIELSATNLAAKGLGGVMQEMAGALRIGANDLDAMQQAGASEAEIMALVAQRSGVATAALAELFPNVRALRGALALASQGGKEFSADVQAMAQATGASAAAFAEQSKSLQVQWNKTWAAVQAVMVQVGATALPVLKALTGALRIVVQAAEDMGAWRSVVAVVALLAAGFASLTAAFILYNAYLKEAVLLAGGFTGAARQMIASLAAANVQINLSSISLARIAAGAKAAGAALVGMALSPAGLLTALAATLTVAYTGLREADRKANEFGHTLAELDQRAVRLKVALDNVKPPSTWDLFWESLGVRTAGMDRALAEMTRYKQRVDAAEQAQDNSAARTAKLKQIEQELARFRGEAHAARMKEIADEQERRDMVLQAEQRLVDALIGHEEEIAGARERIHRVRMEQIESEAQAMKRALIQGGRTEAEAEVARRQFVAARTADLSKQEAEERARAFEESANQIVSTWITALEGMRQADRLQTGEYLAQLARVLDLMRQINVARAEAGQSRLFQQDELRLAETIFAERRRMQSELESDEKRLADARTRWAQEELEQRRRLHEYERSLIDLTFQHRRDLARVSGEDDEETMARIAAAELAALQKRRTEEQLTAQERLDSLERERQLILEMAQGGAVSEGGARGALEATFEAMRQAREELAAQDRAAFAARSQEQAETIKQIEAEQKTLRDQLSQTGGQVVQIAQRVFDTLQQRLQALATVRLQPAVAGAAAAAGPAQGARTYNFYIGGRQVTAGADINRIADQLAEMLEREHTYARD